MPYTKPVLYPLQPRQQVFSNSGRRFRLYGGAKGGGKSYAMRAECVRQCLSAPWVRGIALRRTFPEIRENMIEPMLAEIPRNLYTYNISLGKITFYNGSTLKFSYCRNYNDVLRYQGIQYDFICIEELTHWTERDFDILRGCLRTARHGIVPNFFGSTNPWGVGHGWVKRRWVNRDFRPLENGEDYDFIPAKVTDNLILMETQPQYAADLDSLPDLLRRAYRDGDWDVFEGQYFTEWNRDIHVIPACMPRDTMRRFVAFDYGYKNPSAVYWFAILHDRSIVVYRELYITGLTYRQLAARIRAMASAEEVFEITVADPAIVAKRSETTGTSGKDEMESVWLKIVWGDNSRVKWWQIVRGFLQVESDPNTGEKAARLRVCDNCPNLIRTLPEMVHDPVNVEDIDTKTEDHAPDALRYGLVYAASVIGTKPWELGAMNKKLTKANESGDRSKGDTPDRHRDRRADTLLNISF